MINPKCPKCNRIMRNIRYKELQAKGIPENLVKFIENRKAKYYGCHNCYARYILVFPNKKEYLWNTENNLIKWRETEEKVIFT